MLALAARRFDAGVIVATSHNPPQYNGVKLWNTDGSTFDSNQRKQVEERIVGGCFSIAPWNEIRSGSTYSETIVMSEAIVMSTMEQRLMAMKPLSVSTVDGIELNSNGLALRTWPVDSGHLNLQVKP